MMSRDGISTQVVDADPVYRANGVDAMGTWCVKGTIDIPKDLVLRDHDLISRVLGVLVRQWGLDTVEVRIRADNGESPGVTNFKRQCRLEIAGHSFPLTLADC
jgi:hypothetical protein